MKGTLVFLPPPSATNGIWTSPRAHQAPAVWRWVLQGSQPSLERRMRRNKAGHSWVSAAFQGGGEAAAGAEWGKGEHEPAVHPWGSARKLQSQLGPGMPSLPFPGTRQELRRTSASSPRPQDGRDAEILEPAGLEHTARLEMGEAQPDTGRRSAGTGHSRDRHNWTHTTRIFVGRPAKHWHRPWSYWRLVRTTPKPGWSNLQVR